MFFALALSFGAAAGVCVGLLFVVAAVAKLRNRAELPAVIANYRLLPRPLVTPVALLLPWAEAAIGLALLVGGRAAGLAAWPAAALLIAFAGAMHVNLRRGRSHIDCGCGIGGLHQPLRRALVLRNLLLAAALLPLAALPASLGSLDRALSGAAGAAAFLLMLLLNAVLALPGARAVGGHSHAA